jgi:3-isopropylmalate dehydrogenase
MWRRVVADVAADYPDVELRHGLVDSVAMQIVTDPQSFDVLVMENTFGDILSDVAAAVTGGLGLAASASLGDSNPGIFEPVHGSAPDIAGTGAANPTAMLRSLALLLEHSLGEPELARSVAAAVAHAGEVAPTPDLGGTATTSELGSAVLDALAQEVTA